MWTYAYLRIPEDSRAATDPWSDIRCLAQRSKAYERSIISAVASHRQYSIGELGCMLRLRLPARGSGAWLYSNTQAAMRLCGQLHCVYVSHNATQSVKQRSWNAAFGRGHDRCRAQWLLVPSAVLSRGCQGAVERGPLSGEVHIRIERLHDTPMEIAQERVSRVWRPKATVRPGILTRCINPSPQKCTGSGRMRQTANTVAKYSTLQRMQTTSSIDRGVHPVLRGHPDVMRLHCPARYITSEWCCQRAAAAMPTVRAMHAT